MVGVRVHAWATFAMLADQPSRGERVLNDLPRPLLLRRSGLAPGGLPMTFEAVRIATQADEAETAIRAASLDFFALMNCASLHAGDSN